MLRLIKWADKKAIPKEDKQIKILGFGHEDYMVKFLEDEFKQEGILNCETVQFSLDELKNIHATARNKTEQL